MERVEMPIGNHVDIHPEIGMIMQGALESHQFLFVPANQEDTKCMIHNSP
jgi:hypothetical protein